MYNQLLIRPDTPTAKLIGYTSDLFEYGTLYNALPQGIYIGWLQPREGKEDYAIEHLLNKLEENKIRVLFTAPQPFIIKHLKNHKYIYYTDPAGTPLWTRLSEKGIAALCGRLNITPERLKLQSECYAV